jgi:urease accessory protein UreE
MPAVTYMGVDQRRDHAFSIPRPDVASQIGAPDVCTSCHTDRPQSWAASQIVEWFGPRRRDDPHPALAIHAGRHGDAGADRLLAAVATNRAHAPILRATAISLLPMPPSQASAQAIGATLLDLEPLVRTAALRTLDGLHPRNRLHAARFLADETRLVRIEAAPQALLRITTCPQHGTPFDLTRAAYHLGNRHVPIELKPDHLKIEPDAVLAEMLRSMHLIVNTVEEAFEPEGGAYGSHHGGSGHSHDHDHEHDHDHHHGHGH